MAFDIKSLMNAATTGAASESIEKDFEEIRLDYEKIIVTGHNKYSMDEIGELAAGIEMAGGLHEPLILGRVNGEYWLASGHRRHAAIGMLVQSGEDKFRMVNCRYKDMTETEFRLHVLIGNAFNRHYTDYDKMIEAEEWKSALKAAQREKLLILEKGERVRDYVARVMGTSATVVGDYNRINKNATQQIKDQFKDGIIGVTVAAAASQLPEDEQKEIAGRVAAGEDIKAQEIRGMMDAKKAESVTGGENKEKRSITEQKMAQVSDTDTNEEEKENVRRLHLLKMLEKYYIYMSGEEVDILERMLEDCKRRKREYALDGAGSIL